VADVRLGEKLAEGACAEIFAWGGDGTQIVKVAKPNTNLFALQRELRHCQIAHGLGLPVPQPFDLVETGGRNGIVLERIVGESILQRFAGRALSPDEDCLMARTTARLLHRIHGQATDGVPEQYGSLERDIRRSEHLGDAEKDAVMALLDALPRKRQLCHGDPNPGNFLLRGDDVVVVDWNNATLGNPEADLAEYVLMLRYASLPASSPAAVAGLFEASRDSSIRLFIDEYQRLSGIGMAEIEPWIAPIAARKLAVDGIAEAEKDQLVAEVRQRLPGAANF
jgi:aminoglycoside phosphotransferase (APT) family kinase protein